MEAERAAMEPEAGRAHGRPISDGVAPGWYLACFSRELKRGKALPVTLADQELVLYRTETGQVVVQEQFCPHLGGNMAMGKVVGETIRCPFHFWRFDPTGACVEIPRCAKIPPKARLRTYPCAERLEGVWVYVGGERPYEELPSHEQIFGGPFYCSGVDDYGEVRLRAREILENSIDAAHGLPVHGLGVDRFTIRGMDSAVPTIEGEVDFDFFWGKLNVRCKATSSLFGPGLWVAWQKGGYYYTNGVVLHLPTPVTRDVTRLRAVSFICDAPWKPWVRVLGRLLFKETRGGSHQDLVVWRDKLAREHPVLSGTEGPIMAFRGWYAHLWERARAADQGLTADLRPGAQRARRRGDGTDGASDRT